MNRRPKLMIAALILLLSVTAPSYAATNKAAANRAAHAAYYKKLDMLKEQDSFLNNGSITFTDLTNDGVDEMVVGWFPSIYTYRKGKAVRVSRLMIGSSHYTKYWPKKKVLRANVPDHVGGTEYEYYKWNGVRFIKVASTYTPKKGGKAMGFSASYWVRGKGKVSKAVCSRYIKRLISGAKGRRIKYDQQY